MNVDWPQGIAAGTTELNGGKLIAIHAGSKCYRHNAAEQAAKSHTAFTAEPNTQHATM